ncbi:MAG TPA: CsbD family protein [Candidatus Bathyarchaeia archaeon]|nr:CsbD family protein [Candidatus Bathyarchaeia archaeon]
MNRETMKGQWMQFKGKVKQQWGKLTDDDLDQIQGNYEMLIGRLMERHGRSREEIEKEVDSRFGQWQEPMRKAS